MYDMTVLVTGGAGFIGSHIVDWLVGKKEHVVVVDNLSSGSLANIERHVRDGKVVFVKGDLKDPELCLRVLRDHRPDIVIHLAANPEVRVSVTEPRIHFQENVVATFNLLEACRVCDSVSKLVFVSSSTVYGDAKVLPTPEDHELRPISVYGACKASCELLLHAYSQLYGIRGVVLRYANIIGPRARHGVIYDFIMKLKKDPTRLEILGDGTQKKSYLYVDDAISATMIVTFNENSRYEVYNIGNEDWITVREIADIVCEVLDVKPTYIFVHGTPDGRGWLGDVKFMLLSIEKLKRKFSWRPRYTSREAVRLTAEALKRELWHR